MAAARLQERVFVIQLTSDADPGRDRMVGRVEHVGPGRSARFASEEEMREFIARTLRELEASRTNRHTENSGQNH
jgi:hypothetical protein